MQLRELTYVPEAGGDILLPIGQIDFNSHEHVSKEGAARALHAALVKWADARGYNSKNIMLWAPDVAESSMTRYRAWTICWEEGPFEWALNVSGEMDSGPWGYTEPYNSFILTFTC